MTKPCADQPLSNWARWGDDDETGAANFVGREHVVRAAGLVREGRVFSLALPIRKDKVPIAPIRFPALHFMSLDGGDFAAGATLGGGSYQAADDYLFMACHGGTHVDALSHVWYDDQLYNGHPANRVRSYGATRCGIENLPYLVTRGVLLDIAGFAGVDHLGDGQTITATDLAACADACSLQIGTADCVLIRTGWQHVFFEDPERYHASSPGIGLEAGRWLAKRQVSAVGADNMALEVETAADRYEGGSPAPLVHKLLIRDCGTYVLELLDLEELAASGIVEFLFVMSPLKIVGGVGSPINPVAIA